MNTQDVSKVIFLLFVVGMAVYFIVNNKTPIIEKYADAPLPPKTPSLEATPKMTLVTTPQSDFVEAKSLRQSIIEVYKELYGAEPKENELSFYVKFFKNRQVTRDYIKEIISTSAPTLQKTLAAGTLPLIPDTPIGTEDEVIEIYNTILDRNPDPEELQYYSTYVKQGLGHIEKMKLLLLQSQEYKRLQKTQNNFAYGHLLGGITDRQLTMMVTSVYNQLTKEGDKIDDETLKFLKKKYLEFQLDEVVFRRFVKDYVLFKPTSSGTTNAAARTTNASSTSTVQKPNSTIIQSLATSAAASPAPVTTTATTEKYQNTTTASGAVNTTKMIENIKTKADCQFDKNKLDNTTRSNSEQALASTINDRNRDELKNICQRNTTYSRYHYDDLVLLPGQEWSVPQKHPPVCSGRTTGYNPLVEQSSLIGTLLPDAKDTEVGSIMPKFTYKEYYD